MFYRLSQSKPICDKCYIILRRMYSRSRHKDFEVFYWRKILSIWFSTA